MRKYCLLDRSLIYQGEIIQKFLYHIGKDGFRILYAYSNHEDGFGKEIYLPNIECNIEDFCFEKWDITPDQWIEIEDAWDFCNLDFIIPTRRKGRDTGEYFGDIYEQFNNDTKQWEKINIY